MKTYLTKYSVNGIKSIDQEITLSFYKKTITKPIDIKDYNVKAIYGMNGSGKSAIIKSVDILKNILLDSKYLNNPIMQKELEESFNKKSGQLDIITEFIFENEDTLKLLQYCISITKDLTDHFVISNESLKQKNATSRQSDFEIVYDIKNGEIEKINQDKSGFYELVIDKTKNLLNDSTLCSVCYNNWKNNIFPKDKINCSLNQNIYTLLYFANNISVCFDQEDIHANYFINKYYPMYEEKGLSKADFLTYIQNNVKGYYLKSKQVMVPKKIYKYYQKEVKQLQDFIKIFKNDLEEIVIDRKEDEDFYICNLVMKYNNYDVSVEFESTGIKKLIRLFVYLKDMVSGGIVFIDELDANLHDVYLCALLEYLMNYGEGQLCFTTHNIGPMDILKQNKQSIEFLSMNHKIYSWKKNGHYLPSKLYKEGMIEGSPFNIDAIDFIGIIDSGEEE